MPVRKYVVEFIGTFFLVFTIGQCVHNGAGGVIAPLAIGAALMAMIYAGGHISGAHYNPAVTLAVYVRGRVPLADVFPYMIAQFLGGLAAAALVLYLKDGGAAPGPAIPVAKSLIVEFLFTFALAYVVLNVATSKATAGNSFYGLAIAFTVVAGAFAVGAISGGAFNPAVASGITMMGLTRPSDLWVHLAADFAGGLVAGLAFRALNPDDK